MTILLVEDDSIILESVKEYLTEQGYMVVCAKDGKSGWTLFQQHAIDLAILDIMLPQMNGIELLHHIRETSTIPVIMLTALGDEATQVKSFDELADDYMCKPFSLLVLNKRIEALLRRQKKRNVWVYQDAYVDFTAFYATYQGIDAEVKPKEIQLLEMLLKHPHQVLTREQILDLIWKEEGPYERVVDTYVKNLRKKLHLDCIKTVKGIGYKIEI